MTAAHAIPLDVSPDARDRSSDVALWEYVATTGLEALVAATSKDPNAKITVLLVSPQSGLPEVAVKVPTTAAAEGAVALEAQVLAELRSEPLGTLEETIPRLVGFVEFEERRAAVMTALQGRPLSTAYAQRRHTRDGERVAADFAAVGSWLAELQHQTGAGRAALEMNAGVVLRLHERFGLEPGIDRDVERLRALHARLRLDQVTRTVVHGDFWFGNVLVSGGRVSGVVDWEAATTRGEPVRDLVRFANMYALYLDCRTRRGGRVAGHRGLRADRWGAGLEYAIAGSGWFPTLYRRFLEEGLARLGADPENWRDAALAGIAEVAALTDHEDFGRLHLELFRRLASREATE